MDRYQFRLDGTDPRQRELMAMLDAAPSGRRNRLIVDMLLRGSGAAPPAQPAAPTLEDIRAAVIDAIRDAGLLPAATAPARGGVPADIYDVLDKF